MAVRPSTTWAGRKRLRTGVSTRPMPPPTLVFKNPTTSAAMLAAEASATNEGSGTERGSFLDLLAHPREEVVQDHLGDAAQHALADAGDEPADLDIGAVAQARPALHLGELQGRRAADESLPRPAPAFGRCAVLPPPDRFELLAAGHGRGEPRGVEERGPDLRARRGKVVRPFDLHGSPGATPGGISGGRYEQTRWPPRRRRSPPRGAAW